jgi:hypothetical protein
VYTYDTSKTETVVWTHAEAFTNTKNVCPITSCTVKQSDCSTSLATPFDSLISVDPSSYSLKISQTQTSGYPNVVVCYACTNHDGNNGHTGHSVSN